jgi:hypothetical protein
MDYVRGISSIWNSAISRYGLGLGLGVAIDNRHRRILLWVWWVGARVSVKQYQTLGHNHGYCTDKAAIMWLGTMLTACT